MAGDSCDQKSVHVKKVNNVRHDGQTYETALNTVTRKKWRISVGFTGWTQSDCEYCKKSSAKVKGRDWFEIVVEPPSADLGLDLGSKIKPTSSSASVTRKRKSVYKVTTTNLKKRGMAIAVHRCMYRVVL